MEYHIVYSTQRRPSGRVRGYQEIQLGGLGVFSTYEESRLYVQMVASVDRHTYGRGNNGEYHVRALPFDLPPDQFTRVLAEEHGEGWRLPSYPWHSIFSEPFRFDAFGEKECQYRMRFNSFETRAMCRYNEGACAGQTPQFGCGDLVYLPVWVGWPDTYGVVTALWTKAGKVCALTDADVWLGWYSVLMVDPGGGLADEDVHVAFDCDMQPLPGELPDEMKILEVLSRHCKGESVLPGDVVDRLFNEHVLTQPVESFPFHLFDGAGA